MKPNLNLELLFSDTDSFIYVVSGAEPDPDKPNTQKIDKPRQTQTNLELLYSDTDSFIYVVRTNDVIEDLKEMSEQFDFSIFPKTSPMYSDSNRRKVLKWKDELAGKINEEFVGSKPKLYSSKIQS